MWVDMAKIRDQTALKGCNEMLDSMYEETQGKMVLEVITYISP